MNNQINYIEFKTNDIKETKRFYNACFGWQFTDYGQNYISFSGAGIDGGFEFTHEPIVNGVLVVIHHNELNLIEKKIKKEGGKVVVELFSFPGGKRFQFLDPSGNELAVWCQE